MSVITWLKLGEPLLDCKKLAAQLPVPLRVGVPVRAVEIIVLPDEVGVPVLGMDVVDEGEGVGKELPVPVEVNEDDRESVIELLPVAS